MDWLKENRKRTIGNIIVVISLFVVIGLWAENTKSLSLGGEEVSVFTLALTILIVFVWRRVSKRFDV